MAVYQGAAWLPEQLASFEAQRDARWRLIAADDGSTDRSPAILADFAARHAERVRIVAGPGAGASANFHALLAQAPPGPLAFSDQDDVWHPGKLARALALLPQDGPALYGARTRIVAEDLTPLRLSPPRRRRPDFGNALVQNFAGGNTMVLNAAGAEALRRLSGGAPPMPHFDWWAYQAIAGIGGRVIHDDTPCLDYRQHGRNVVGAGRGRRHALREGGWLDRCAAQIPALHHCAAALTPQNRAALAAFEAALAAPGPLAALRALRRSGAWRMRRGETLALHAAMLTRSAARP